MLRTGPGEGTSEGRRPRWLTRWGTLLAVGAANLLVLVDFMAVAVALPALSRGIGPSFAQLQWVLEAFVLALVVFPLTAGHVADLVGRRPVFLVGLLVVVAGALGAALASSPYLVIAARALEGLGGALVLATGSVLLGETFERDRRGVAVAVWGTVTGAGVAIAPLVGGVVSARAGWRYLFYLQAALAALALFVGLVALVEPARSRRPARTGARRRADWKGLALFAAAVAILVVGLVRTTTSTGDWTSTGVLACFGASGLLLVAFVGVEIVSPAPMLAMGLFRRRTFTGASVAAFGLSAAVLGPAPFLALYLYLQLGYSTLAIGSGLVLLTGVTLVFLPFTGWLGRVVPVKLLICAGLVLVGAGLWLLSRSPLTSWSSMAPGLLVAGAGLELVSPRLALASAATVGPELAPVAARASSTFRQLGTAIGVAALGSLLATRLRDDIAHAVSAVPGAVGQSGMAARLVLDGHFNQAAALLPSGTGALGALHAGLTDAMHRVFLAGSAVALASALVSLVVRSADVRAVQAAAPAAPASQPAPAEAPEVALAGAPAPAGPLPRSATGGAGAPGLEAADEGGPAREAAQDAPSQTGEAQTGEAQTGVPETAPRADLARAACWLRGSVVGTRGEPQAGAEVRLVGPEGSEVARALVAKDGGFTLSAPEEGRYQLVATAPSTLPATAWLQLRPGVARTEVTLVGSGTVSGHVVRAATGEPLEAGVQLLEVDREAEPGHQAVCGPDGSFSLRDVAEGAYHLVAGHPGYVGTTVALTVARGEVTALEVGLRGTGHIYGAVSSPDGAWLASVTLTLADPSGTPVATTATDGAGAYRFGDVPEGCYTLRVGHSSHVPLVVQVTAGQATPADLVSDEVPNPVPS